MNKIVFIGLFFIAIGNTTVFCQTKKKVVLTAKDSLKSNDIDPLTPAKAAFYSAILPGLGQAYNKKYWKVPLVYGAIGTSLYYYSDSNTKYNQYRDAYKRRLEGFTDDDYTYLDNSRLISAQKFYQKNRDLSALLTGLFYVLNILEANVDAHLMHFNVNDNLTVKPDLYRNEFTTKQDLGICVTWKL